MMPGGNMISPEWAALLLTGCGLLSGGCLKLWHDLKASRKAELEAAEARGYERSRNEALVREAQATVAQKNAELDEYKRQNALLHERMDMLVSALRRLSQEGRSA